MTKIKTECRKRTLLDRIFKPSVYLYELITPMFKMPVMRPQGFYTLYHDRGNKYWLLEYTGSDVILSSFTYKSGVLYTGFHVLSYKELSQYNGLLISAEKIIERCKND